MTNKWSFDSIAQAYAETVDTKPIHLYYERPHLWSLLPANLKGLNVLDLGCGSGWYAEQLQKAGAQVTALDASPIMIELTKKRLNHQGRFYLADLEKPLYFLDAHEFDIILAPLVIHYIKDWEPFFLRLSKTLKPNGLFIFSTHQPHTEMNLFQLSNYFEKTLLKDYWPHIGEVQFYHHTLHEMSQALYQANLIIEKMLEPLPLPSFQEVDPQMYENISKKPWFLFVRAKKDPINLKL